MFLAAPIINPLSLTLTVCQWKLASLLLISPPPAHSSLPLKKKKKKNLTHPGQSRGRGGYKKSLPERADSGARVMMIQSQTSWLISANICKCPSQLPSRSLFASGGDGLECDLTPQGLLLICVCVCVCVCVGGCMCTQLGGCCRQI